MPHLLIEFSENLEAAIDIQDLLETLHAEFAVIGKDAGVELDRIKSRATCFNYYAVGEKGKDGYMFHITLLLLSGRTDEAKKRIGGHLHKIASDVVKAKLPDASITLDVRDMDRKAYQL
ncbi:MAG: hypothetical protein CMH30_08325 [Micavibrio sp.]|nr:hypothetical protein [Micavibrio sp.]